MFRTNAFIGAVMVCMTAFPAYTYAVETADLSCLGPPPEASTHVLRDETDQLCALYKSALQEGGHVVLWAGGDVPDQMNWFKTLFEQRFPGVTLDVLVDLSKFHDLRIDDELAKGYVTPDVAMLQTTFDFPKWKAAGELMAYRPIGFAAQKPGYADPDGAWITAWNHAFVPTSATALTDPPQRYEDLLAPRFKGHLVMTYPHDDDAVLFVYDQLQKRYGTLFLIQLAQQQPEFLRGTGAPAYVVGREPQALANLTGYATSPGEPSQHRVPEAGPFVVWNQRVAIFGKARHPESARLLVSYLSTAEMQSAYGGWRSRADVGEAPGLPALETLAWGNPQLFTDWMADRERVARLRQLMRHLFGPVQGESPLRDAALLRRQGLGPKVIVAPPEPARPPY